MNMIWYMFLFIITSCVKYNLPRYTHMLRWTMPVYILILLYNASSCTCRSQSTIKMYSHHGSIINCNIARRSHLVFCWFGVWDLYMLFSFRDPLRPVHCDTCTYNEFFWSSSAFVCKLITKSDLYSSPRSQLQ